jgi:hypothetical protein
VDPVWTPLSTMRIKKKKLKISKIRMFAGSYCKYNSQITWLDAHICKYTEVICTDGRENDGVSQAEGNARKLVGLSASIFN